MEVKLLTIFRQKFSKQKAIMKILLKAVNPFRKLDLIVEPVQ